MLERIFNRTFTLNRIRDRITIKEGNERLQLTVDSDPNAIVTRILSAQKAIDRVRKTEATDEERISAAKEFAEAIFGQDQADKIAVFYNHDYSCVVTICGLYFERRLCKIITKAQKKQK